MSCFLCGKFLVRENSTLAEQTDFAFKAIEFAAAERLALSLGYNIVQDLVFEILNMERANRTISELPFLITDSPLCDTSDELLSPCWSEETDSHQIIEQNLWKIRRFFGRVLTGDQIVSAKIIFTEGYDIAYQEVNLTLDSFVSCCLEIFKAEDRVPSLKVILHKA